MQNRLLNTIIFTFICLFFTNAKSHAQSEIEDRHIKVAMRMIGHEILLHSGDSVSRVLAVEKESDRYKIHFESAFQFFPEDLVATVDSIIHKSNIANRYIVEIENCENHNVVYSYEIGSVEKTDIIPCRGRKLPRACYVLYISILESNFPMMLTSIQHEAHQSEFKFIWLSIPLLILLALFFFYGKKKTEETTDTKDPDLISIGSYVFDKRNMTLSFEDEKTELTSKESDLLFLLFSSANNTLEREHLLKVVWGDEGDYIGRTLDVFISKLRKKLAGDENLKIVNIRGIGYKFVVNDRKAN